MTVIFLHRGTSGSVTVSKPLPFKSQELWHRADVASWPAQASSCSHSTFIWTWLIVLLSRFVVFISFLCKLDLNMRKDHWSCAKFFTKTMLDTHIQIETSFSFWNPGHINDIWYTCLEWRVISTTHDWWTLIVHLVATKVINDVGQLAMATYINYNVWLMCFAM